MIEIFYSTNMKCVNELILTKRGGGAERAILFYYIANLGT